MQKEFPELKNDIIIRAARGEKTEYIPVWIMRQAGRYLPEFREFRQHHSFFDICETPELACEATMLPIRRFPALDAAIIFSDILVIPKALGMNVQMVEGIGPVVEALQTPKQFKSQLQLDNDIDTELDYVYKAITLTRHTLDGKVPLIGFAGGPFTLMSYMVEGQGSKTMSKVKRWFYQNPVESHELLNILTESIIKFLVGQVKAGAQLLQIFESHAGYLGSKQFDEFCLPYLQRISSEVRNELRKQQLNEDVPMILFAKGAHYALDKLCDTSSHQYNVIGIDWTIDIARAKQASKGQITLQGNLDPCALYANQDDLDYLVEQMVQEFGGERYIANLGHGIYPDVKWENVSTFINAVHKYSKKLIASSN